MADQRRRVDKIRDWLEANAEWIEAAPNVQLVFDCAGPHVKVRPTYSEQIGDRPRVDRMSA